MREFKFRVWDSERNRMSSPFKLDGFAVFFVDDTIPIQFLSKNNRFKKMQYTGLHDKNGKEIYEGDVVIYPQYYFNDHLMSSGMEVIEWEGPGFNEVLWAGHGNYPAYVEVVGNIYKNPELLKEA